jgi:two-component sensor histidine kinase
MAAPLPENEEQRLAALRGYEILDTGAETGFDEITRTIAEICDTPVALVSLLDEHRQWFKARHGIDVAETAREHAFCGHAVLNPGELLEVPDASADERFAANPLVTGDPRIRFYAGAPLTTAEGHALGTLCVIDLKPRQLTASQRTCLKALSKQVMAQLELRRALREKERALKQKDMLLKEVNHRVKNGLQMIGSLMQLQKRKILDPVAQQQIADMGTRIQTLATVHRHLYRHDDLAKAELGSYLREVCKPLANSADVDIAVDAPTVLLPVDALVPLAMIISELVTNAAKYARVAGPAGAGARRPHIWIEGALLPALPNTVDATDSQHLHLSVRDDGPGLPLGFDLEQTTGLGMRVITSLVQQLDGTIAVGPGPGAQFEIDVKMKAVERG